MADIVDIQSEEFAIAYVEFLETADERHGKPIKVSYRRRQVGSKGVGSYQKSNGQRTPRRFRVGLFGRSRQKWLSTFRELRDGIPSLDTFNRLLTRVNAETRHRHSVPQACTIPS